MKNFLMTIAAGALAFIGAVHAQSYPSKSIRYVVPYAPGGSTDIVARVLALKLSEAMGQQVVVDNRPGAGGAIGADIVAKSPPDGYTMVTAVTSIMAINQFLYRKLPYDPEKDFAPVTQVGSLPLILVIHPSLPAKNVREFIAIAKAKPGQLNYGSSGVGTATHMTTELFKAMAGVDLVHIPYKGSGQVMGDVIGGQLALIFDQIVSSLPHVQGGKLRMLAITSAKRFPSLPDLPTIAESGVPGYESISWAGVAVPAGTPKEIVARLHAEIVKVLAMPDIRERFLRDGIETIGSTPEQFSEHIRRERIKWAKVVKDSGAKAD
ncbi:MAG TPA: tripartite tricarboxylate transporter substrate binding protein [Burkholderiales bacterium]|jgi:tripartite-type tricarboxylate transporter receptor subunit TctC|nr:tripartite tricarboxylate transporter substrate binding protein [Burkholderiales bacterium]